MRQKQIVKINLDAPELRAIEKSRAKQIQETFEPMVKNLEEFEGEYNDLMKETVEGITEEITRKAKRLRLDIGRVRIETEKIRKDQKAEYLRAGQAIDGVSNILKWAVTEKENKLKEVEHYFEIQEQKRLVSLQIEREKLLAPYIDDANERDLARMDEDVFEAFLERRKIQHQQMIEAERQAELTRQEEERQRKIEEERIRKENARLKREAVAREKRLAKERAEREKEEALLQEQREKEMQERLDRENELRKKQAEEKAKRLEAERKLQAKLKVEEEARELKHSRKDSDKVTRLVLDLAEIEAKYKFRSKANQAMFAQVCKSIKNLIKLINDGSGKT